MASRYTRLAVQGLSAAKRRAYRGGPLAVQAQTATALAALALAALALAGCPQAPEIPGDIVLISVDTLRPDHLGIYGYSRPTSPHIDRFFADAAIYERAYSTTASTGPSVVSLLTGQLPHEHRVRLLYQLVGKDVALVTDLLPEAYQKAAFVSNIVLTSEALGIADRFDYYDDYIDERESVRSVWERSAGRTTDAALRWLAEERDPERPLFLWLHYIDPHGPYHTPEAWTQAFQHSKPKLPIPKSKIVSYMSGHGFDDAWLYVDRYDDEIAYVDAQVGRLIDGYGSRLDDALVIFTADHGETMIEQETWFTHGYHIYDSIVRVPLLVRGPGVASKRISKLAQGTDVAPTLLRFSGALAPDTMPAVDLRSGEGLDPQRTIVVEATSGTSQWRGVIRGDEKWSIHVRGHRQGLRWRRHQSVDEEGGDAPMLAWTDSDPEARQLLELIETDPDPAGVPRGYAEGVRIEAPKVDPRVDAETLEKLRTLGYAE